MSIKARLSQDRLDVEDKVRGNFFSWRGQFTPQFVAYLMDSFVKPGDTVMDAFSGSGTVLAECAMKDIVCYGYEINPAAYAMSKFFTFANVPHMARQVLLHSLETKLKAYFYADLPLFHKETTHPKHGDLGAIAKTLFGNITNDLERLLALNTLFLACSHTKQKALSSVLHAFSFLRHQLASIPYTEVLIQAYLGDARLVHDRCPSQVDCILTSPPYINVFNYHQNYRSILEGLGCDVLLVAQSEIGANRKNRGNRFRTVVQYCLDMEQVLTSFWHCLKPGGVMLLVIGRESKVRSVQFFNGLIVKELITALGGFDQVSGYERKYTNRFGAAIVEDILITHKNDTEPSTGCAKFIAHRHLLSALDRAPNDVKPEIRNATEVMDSISASPLLTGEEVRLNV